MSSKDSQEHTRKEVDSNEKDDSAYSAVMSSDRRCTAVNSPGEPAKEPILRNVKAGEAGSCNGRSQPDEHADAPTHPLQLPEELEPETYAATDVEVQVQVSSTVSNSMEALDLTNSDYVSTPSIDSNSQDGEVSLLS